MASNVLRSLHIRSLAMFAGTMAALCFSGCGSSNDTSPTRSDGAGQGGSANVGGAAGTGGSSASSNTGQPAVGGSSAVGASSGGKSSIVATGGASPSTGGAGPATGGSQTTSTGGAAPGTGGAKATGTGGANCVAAATPSAASMNPGQGCTPCHSGASPSAGVLITLGGTVFSASSGGSGVSGATVTITDNSNVVTKLVTGTDGNFYTNATIAFPAKVAVSKCPDTATMVSTVTSGNCNSCHGSSMQIHLP